MVRGQRKTHHSADSCDERKRNLCFVGRLPEVTITESTVGRILRIMSNIDYPNTACITKQQQQQCWIESFSSIMYTLETRNFYS